MKKQLAKDIGMLAWVTQLGLSVAFPLAGFVLLAVWLKNRFGWGNWVNCCRRGGRAYQRGRRPACFAESHGAHKPPPKRKDDLF